MTRREARQPFSRFAPGTGRSRYENFPRGDVRRGTETQSESLPGYCEGLRTLRRKQGDPEKALGMGMKNLQADDQNDVGWGILTGNFERHLTQLQPEESSVGLWDVGPAKHPYGRFVRRFDAASGRTVMRFQIADGFFERPSDPHAVRVRVVYLDRGKGRWELAYATPQGEKAARRVELANSGQWRETVVTLPDAVWNHRLVGGGDLALRHIDGENTICHRVEMEKLCGGRAGDFSQ